MRKLMFVWFCLCSSVFGYAQLRVSTLYGYGWSGLSYDRANLPVIGVFYNETLPGLIKELPGSIQRYLVDVPKLSGEAYRKSRKWDFALAVKSDWPGCFIELRTHGGRFNNAGTLLSPKNLLWIFNPTKYAEAVFNNYVENSGINVGVEASVGIKPHELITGFHDISFGLSRKKSLHINEYASYVYAVDFTKKAGYELFHENINYETWIRERLPNVIEQNFDIASIASGFAKRIEQSVPSYIFGVPKDAYIRIGCEVRYVYKGKHKTFECFMTPEYMHSMKGYSKTWAVNVFGGIKIK